MINKSDYVEWWDIASTNFPNSVPTALRVVDLVIQLKVFLFINYGRREILFTTYFVTLILSKIGLLYFKPKKGKLLINKIKMRISKYYFCISFPFSFLLMWPSSFISSTVPTLNQVS